MEKRGIFCKIATLGLTFTCKKSILEFEMKRVSKNWNRVRVSRGRFMKKEKNIYTIAKEAGVSPATVSRVMTKNARVSEEKRKKVEEIIQKYDYRPNALAQGLTNARTKIIGILAADMMNPFYAQLVDECVKEIGASGYVPMIFSSQSSYEMEEQYLQKMFDLRVDAIILMGGKSDQLVTDLEYVDLLDRITDTTPIITTGKIEGSLCYQVCIDEMASVDLAMEHLFSLGYRHIALIGGKNHIRSTYDKRMRYRMLLRKNGITYRERYVTDSDYNIEGGYQCMEKLFQENRTMPTAVIAINDFSAIGILRCIEEHHLSVPQDISLVSFDGTFLSDIVNPKLTSVCYDYASFGKMLAASAVKLLSGEEIPKIQQCVSRLIVRESTILQ